MRTTPQSFVSERQVGRLVRRLELLPSISNIYNLARVWLRSCFDKKACNMGRGAAPGVNDKVWPSATMSDF